MFNRIKMMANVHEAWEILKQVFEEQSKALHQQNQNFITVVHSI